MVATAIVGRLAEASVDVLGVANVAELPEVMSDGVEDIGMQVTTTAVITFNLANKTLQVFPNPNLVSIAQGPLWGQPYTSLSSPPPQ